VGVSYRTLKVRFEDSICFMQIDRPEANNTINQTLVSECHEVLSGCEESVSVVVLSGSPQVFCFGADFAAIAAQAQTTGDAGDAGPGPMYDLWLRMATGPYITVSHVRGKTNAGGIGFVAASDIVIADSTAQFSLSELLFGLFPACVLPFLIRRVGFQRAHYLTLMTHPVPVSRACEWGLVDAFDERSDDLLRRHLLRLRRLSKPAIRRYKTYMQRISESVADLKTVALAANREVFTDSANLEAIARYASHGVFPWEKS
jgi:polyketide biosynthesis enoyl-CoA hydratase PksH